MNNEKQIDILNVASLEERAKQSMEIGVFGYIQSGADDEVTLKDNTLAFDKRKIVPRVLRGIAGVDISTNFLGIDLSTPIITAPTAANGLAHRNAEIDAAKGTYLAGSVFCMSTYANQLISDVGKVENSGSFFMQLYMSSDDNFNFYIIDEAKKANAKAIILTVDATVSGNREADMKNKFSFNIEMKNLNQFGKSSNLSIHDLFKKGKRNLDFSDIKKVKDYSKLPVIVKGIQSPTDAELAIQNGVDAIWVSNHGGRQLDSGPASIDCLEFIAKAVNKRVPIVFDSGIRRGSHVFKAIALGADIVAIGRPVLYGLHWGGYSGVKAVYDKLNFELETVMQLAGTKDINQIKGTVLH